MIKFETINGTLCRMVEPTPLQLDSEFPCVVRLIQDDSRMGMFNRDTKPSRLSDFYLVARIVSNNIVVDEFMESDYNRFEIIGYPVEEGSSWWALYQMMQGHEVCNSDIHGGAERFAVRDGRIVHHVRNAFEDYCAVDSQFFPPAGLSTGWQLYKEPKPEPEQPKYKVGDWVEYRLDGYTYYGKICNIRGYVYYLSVTTEEIPKDQARAIMLEGIIRKLAPSQVVITIGCLKGTVEPVSINDIHLWFHLIGVDDKTIATIRISCLDAPTRKLVECLLKAQEEKK